jgi:hypothetical protein
MRRGKEAHHVDDFLRPACATDRDLVGQLRQHLFRDVRGHLGGDQAGVTVLTVMPIPSSVLLPDFASW